jgi:hypothetical protein
MSKSVKIGLMVLGGLAIIGATLVGVSFVSAQAGGNGNPPSATGANGAQWPGGPMMGWMGEYRDLYDQTLASALDASVEELQAAREKAQAAVLKQAVADGRLTQAQADSFATCQDARGMMDFQPGMFGAYRDDMQAALASALGMTADELKSALQSGKTIRQLMQENHVTAEQMRAAMDKAHEDILAQAVEDGVITQAQADAMEACHDARGDAGYPGGPHPMMGGQRRHGPMMGGGPGGNAPQATPQP